MKKIKKLLSYFSAAEWTIWLSSIVLIALSFALSPVKDLFSLLCSLMGVTSLIYSAKGNPIGQMLMIAFSIMYGVISYSCAYYGEVITYVFMTCPMSVAALISWLKNPFEKNSSEVRVNKISFAEAIIMFGLAVPVTLIFYFILRAFNTANLIISTISVTTSFLAVYLTAKRSPYYALAYAANDIVLIILWILASIENPEYISTLTCFFVFLINDIYGFISWRRMEKRQKKRSL